VFADGLMIPTGIEPGNGGAYVGQGTELLHLKDTNGDDKADERRVVLRGFGTGDNLDPQSVCGFDLHGESGTDPALPMLLQCGSRARGRQAKRGSNALMPCRSAESGARCGQK
jgi:hypothetical protein